MKNAIVYGLLIGSVAVVVYLVWLLAPGIAIWLETGLKKTLESCVAFQTTECNESFARLGQTGDLFGSVTSVFSGLALLAVAVTIWVDVASRRTSRKPLLVCRIDEEERISFDDPSHTDPRAVRIRVNMRVSALNDVALNVIIVAQLKGSNWSKNFADFAVPVPLASDGAAEIAHLALRLNQAEIEGMVRAYNASPNLSLAVQAKCTSLEGIRWETSVDYHLKFRDSDAAKIRGLLGDQAQLAELWAAQAAVQPDYNVTAGSWEHRRKA